MCTQSKSAEYKVYCTFQSHEPEFDYLKSLEIEEKINRLQWLHRSNPAHFLLSTNGIICCLLAVCIINSAFRNGNNNHRPRCPV